MDAFCCIASLCQSLKILFLMDKGCHSLLQIFEKATVVFISLFSTTLVANPNLDLCFGLQKTLSKCMEKSVSHPDHLAVPSDMS